MVHSENPPQTLNCFPPRLQREQIQSAVPDSSSVAPPNKAEPVWLSKQPRGYVSIFIFFFSSNYRFFFLSFSSSFLNIRPLTNSLLPPPPQIVQCYLNEHSFGMFFPLSNVAVLKVRSRWPRRAPAVAPPPRGPPRKKGIMD